MYVYTYVGCVFVWVDRGGGRKEEEMYLPELSPWPRDGAGVVNIGVCIVWKSCRMEVFTAEEFFEDLLAVCI